MRVAPVLLLVALAGCAAPGAPPAASRLAFGQTELVAHETSDEILVARAAGDTDWTRGTLNASADGLRVRRVAAEAEEPEAFEPVGREPQRLSRWMGATMREGDALAFCAALANEEDGVPELRLRFEVEGAGSVERAWTFRRVAAC